MQICPQLKCSKDVKAKAFKLLSCRLTHAIICSVACSQLLHFEFECLSNHGAKTPKSSHHVRALLKILKGDTVFLLTYGRNPNNCSAYHLVRILKQVFSYGHPLRCGMYCMKKKNNSLSLCLQPTSWNCLNPEGGQENYFFCLSSDRTEPTFLPCPEFSYFLLFSRARLRAKDAVTNSGVGRTDSPGLRTASFAIRRSRLMFSIARHFLYSNFWRQKVSCVPIIYQARQNRSPNSLSARPARRILRGSAEGLTSSPAPPRPPCVIFQETNGSVSSLVTAFWPSYILMVTTEYHAVLNGMIQNKKGASIFITIKFVNVKLNLHKINK